MGSTYGGAVAAPVFSDVVQHTLRILGVQPDMAVRPQIVAQTVEEELLMQHLHSPGSGAMAAHPM